MNSSTLSESNELVKTKLGYKITDMKPVMKSPQKNRAI